MEYERKYNRPVDDAEANAAAFMNQSGGGYDPIKNGNLNVFLSYATIKPINEVLYHKSEHGTS